MNSPIRVSVIAPVYNAAPFLHEFVDSFLSQTLPPESRELIVVDDGSTDESGALLDAYACNHPDIRVIHQENSGWAGKPRNAGIAAARGTYIFFADPDDKFGGTEALERLADFADQHNSDVVVPKMVPKGQRTYAQWRYETTQIDADLATCFTTLTPQKLFRRGFIVEKGLFFPEQKVRLEDGVFLSRAYLQASRVSILTGYEFYHLTRYANQSHLSGRPIDAENYIGSVTVMSENVEKYCSDPGLRDLIINEIYSRKVLSNFKNARVLKHSTVNRLTWLDHQQKYIERFVSRRRYEKLKTVARVRTDLIMAGDVAAIVEYAENEKIDFLYSSAGSTGGKLEIEGRLSGEIRDSAAPHLLVIKRDDRSKIAKIRFRARDGRLVAEIGKDVLSLEASTTRYDLWFCISDGHEMRRVAGPKKPYSVHFTDYRNLEVYTTKSGFLSIAVDRGIGNVQRAQRRVKRLFGG